MWLQKSGISLIKAKIKIIWFERFSLSRQRTQKRFVPGNYKRPYNTLNVRCIDNYIYCTPIYIYIYMYLYIYTYIYFLFFYINDPKREKIGPFNFWRMKQKHWIYFIHSRWRLLLLNSGWWVTNVQTNILIFKFIILQINYSVSKNIYA